MCKWTYELILFRSNLKTLQYGLDRPTTSNSKVTLQRAVLYGKCSHCKSRQNATLVTHCCLTISFGHMFGQMANTINFFFSFLTRLLKCVKAICNVSRQPRSKKPCGWALIIHYLFKSNIQCNKSNIRCPLISSEIDFVGNINTIFNRSYRIRMRH